MSWSALFGVLDAELMMNSGDHVAPPSAETTP
jgi:hypothetical protein